MSASSDFPIEQDSPQSDAARRAWQTAKDRAVIASQKTPYDLRRQVCLCNNAKLTDFSKLLFCRITDMTFENDFKRGDGFIACSKKFLAYDFGVSVDTVTRATRLLETAGFLWTKKIWNGTFELTWWFIREWADDKAEYGRHTGANFGRRLAGVQRNTERNPKSGRFLPDPNSERSEWRAFKAAKRAAQTAAAANGSTVTGQISPDTRQESARSNGSHQPGPTAAVSPAPPQPSALTSGSRQPGRTAAVSPDARQESARTNGSHQPGPTAEMPGLTTLQTITTEGEEESFKRSTGFNAKWKGGGTARKANRENTFLLDVGAMMERWRKGSAKGELSSSGAWWRLAHRADKELLERVLADTLSAVKERRIKQSPGQHAVDLWKRWGGQLPTAEAAP